MTFFHFQFVELKGSVFKKFDKNNLFQVSCSDVRERFHLFSLLFIVVVQTMKEYGWKEGKEIHIFIFVNIYGVSRKNPNVENVVRDKSLALRISL